MQRTKRSLEVEMKTTFNPNNANIEWFDPNSTKIDDNLYYGEVVFLGDAPQAMVNAVKTSGEVLIAGNEISSDSDNLADPMIFSEEEVEQALAHNELEVSDNSSDDEDDVDYNSVYFKGNFTPDPSAQVTNGIRMIDGKPIITGSRLLYATEATINAYCDLEEVQAHGKSITVAFLKKSKAKKVFYPTTREQGLRQVYDLMRSHNKLSGVKGLPALAAACHINGECGYGSMTGIGAYGNLGNFQFDIISNAKAVNRKWPFIIKGFDTKPVEGVDIKYLTANVYHDDLSMALKNYTRWMYSSSRKYWQSFYKTIQDSPAAYVEAFMLDLAARGYFTGTVKISKEQWSKTVSKFAHLITDSDWKEDFREISSKLQAYFDANAPKLAAEMRSWKVEV